MFKLLIFLTIPILQFCNSKNKNAQYEIEQTSYYENNKSSKITNKYISYKDLLISFTIKTNYSQKYVINKDTLIKTVVLDTLNCKVIKLNKKYFFEINKFDTSYVINAKKNIAEYFDVALDSLPPTIVYNSLQDTIINTQRYKFFDTIALSNNLKITTLFLENSNINTIFTMNTQYYKHIKNEFSMAGIIIKNLSTNKIEVTDMIQNIKPLTKVQETVSEVLYKKLHFD